MTTAHGTDTDADTDTDTTPTPPRVRGGFARLLAATGVANLGDGVFQVALPLLAADLTRDPATVAGVVLAMRLPWLLFSLVAGTVIDRVDRRKLIWRTDVVRAILLATLASTIAADQHSMALLYVLAALLGTAETFRDSAAQVILPTLVPSSDLERANGRLFALETVTNRFVGPPLGGLLLAAALALPFALNAGTFAISAVLIASIPGTFRSNRQPSVAAGGAAGTGSQPRAVQQVLHDIGEGLRWLWQHPQLRTLALMLGTFSCLGTAADAVLVLYAQDVLGLGDVGFGVLLTAAAFGALVGGFLVAPIVARFGRTPVLIGSAFAFGVTQVASGLVSSAWLFGAIMVVTAISSVGWNIITVSLRQTVIPDHLLGRVNSAYRFFGWGTMPLGAFLGGQLAAATSLRMPFVLGGIGMLVVTTIALPQLMRAAPPVAVTDTAD